MRSSPGALTGRCYLRGVDVLSCPVVGRGADLRPTLGAQVGVVATGLLLIDVRRGEDPPVWVPARGLQRWLLPGDAEDPAQCAPAAHHVVRIPVGQRGLGRDLQPGAHGTHRWGVQWVAGRFGWGRTPAGPAATRAPSNAPAAAAYRARSSPDDAELADLLEEAARKAAGRESMSQ